jgi:hypothetical protein
MTAMVTRFDQIRSRRDTLKAMGAAVVGAVAGGLLRPGSVAADTGGPIIATILKGNSSVTVHNVYANTIAWATLLGDPGSKNVVLHYVSIDIPDTTHSSLGRVTIHLTGLAKQDVAVYLGVNGF